MNSSDSSSPFGRPDKTLFLAVSKIPQNSQNYTNSTFLERQAITFGIASLSVFSGPSSESEQVWVSAGVRGRWSGWRLIWVLRRLLTAFRELQVLGGNDGSASRSEIKP